MLTNVGRLLTVLSAEAARVAGEEAQTRKPLRERSYAGAAYLNAGRTDTLSEDDAKQACQHPFFGESF